MALGLDFLDDVFCRAVITMPTNKACATYLRVSELCAEAETEQCPWTHVSVKYNSTPATNTNHNNNENFIWHAVKE